jgi:hypothetical protein
MKECLKEKKKTYCFECDDFPCSIIKNHDSSYRKRYQTSLIEYSQQVKTQGLELFMAEQREKYTCNQCGGIISLHDGVCSECDQ